MLIKDLSASIELDQAAMTAVHGGANDSGNAGVLSLTQLMALSAPNMVVAGPGSAVNNFNNVSADQDATQTTEQNNGDLLSIALGFAKAFG
jgi:hypothetical protein